MISKDQTSIAAQEGQPFTRAGYNASVTTVASILGAPAFGERFKLLYLRDSLVNCDPNAMSIDVVYRVFTTDGLSFVTSSFERPNDKVTRAVEIPIPGSGNNKLLPQPYVGFNRSRGFFAGSKGTFKSNSGLFDELNLDASGSGSSGTVEVDVVGSRDYKKGLINHAEWKLGYRYSNIPTDAIRLKDATLRAQAFVGLRPIGPRGLAMRFGASLEGGYRQSDLASAASPSTGTPTHAPYGALKAYAGATMNWGRRALRASYAFQLGQATKKVHVDYVKQVANMDYSVRFLPREHRPLRLEVSGAAGLITSRSGFIPVGERFFGGNARQNFIQGSDWEISSGPTIRSFPQHSLNLLGPARPIGGTNFFSVNLTLAQTVWYRSAIPEELARDAELRNKLTGSITSERENAKSSYLDLAPEFVSLMKDLNELDQLLADLNANLEAVRATGPSATVAAAIDAFFDVDPVSGFRPLPDPRDAIQTAKRDKKQAVDQAVTLAQDIPELSADSYITVLIKTINLAVPVFTTAGISTDKLNGAIPSLQRLQRSILEKIPLINSIGNYDQKDIADVATDVNKLSPVLDNIEGVLSTLPKPASSDAEEYEPRLSAALIFLNAAKDGVSQVNQDTVTVRGAERLAIGYSKIATAVLTGLIDSIRELEASLKQKQLASQAAALENETVKLIALQAEIRKRLKTVRVPEIEKRANQDVKFTGRVLDVIFRELNLVAFSPLIMIDAARIGPEISPGFGKVRYGLGGGLRFSWWSWISILVTRSIRAGCPASGEGRWCSR